MTLTLCYTALSPFCRKVRMAMEHKGLDFQLAPGDHVTEVMAFNPRAEVPVLIDGDTVVCNSPDIMAYLDRKFPKHPLYPQDPGAFAEVREWERLADTTSMPLSPLSAIGSSPICRRCRLACWTLRVATRPVSTIACKTRSQHESSFAAR